jgi:hypothetical protein
MDDNVWRLESSSSRHGVWLRPGKVRLLVIVERATVGFGWAIRREDGTSVARGVSMRSDVEGASREAFAAGERICSGCGRRRLSEDERSVLSIVARSNGPRAREAWDRWSARFCECEGPALASGGVVRSAAS